MRIGVVGSIGGMNLVALPAVAKAAEEVGVWEEVAGFAAASGGAPWAALLAAGLSPDEVIEIARSVRRGDYWRPNRWTFGRIVWLSLIRRQLGATMAETGLDNGRAMEGWLDRTLPVRTFEELQKPLAIPVAIPNFADVKVLTSGDLLTAIRGTTAIPFAYKPADIVVDGYECKAVDGGVARQVPLLSLLGLVADLDVIVAVVAHPQGGEPYIRNRDFDLLTYLDRIIDTLANDHYELILKSASEKMPVVILPVRVKASMERPEETIPPALEAALEQGREFFASELWQGISADPAAHIGQVHVFE